jgi:colicin import membrane protein
MKKLVFSLLGIMVGLASYAQAPNAPSAPSVDAERARIAAERGRIDAVSSTEIAACHERFLVNKCLDEINVKRREALADLRRQEISLNDQERKFKGAEQIRKTEEKNSPEKQQAAADRRAEALKEFEARTDRETQKETSRAEAAGREKSSSEAAADRLRASQEKAAARSVRRESDLEEARKFNERQREAKERKARHEQEKLLQTKPPAKTLPVPE